MKSLVISLVLLVMGSHELNDGMAAKTLVPLRNPFVKFLNEAGTASLLKRANKAGWGARTKSWKKRKLKNIPDSCPASKCLAELTWPWILAILWKTSMRF